MDGSPEGLDPMPSQVVPRMAGTTPTLRTSSPFNEAELRKAGLTARDLASLLKVTWLEALDPPFAEAIERRLDRVLQELPVLEALLPTGAELDSAQLCEDIERLRSICQACLDHARDVERFDEWLRTPEAATIRDGVLSRIYRACRDLKDAAQQALELLRPVAPPVQPSEVDAGSGEGSSSTLTPAPVPPPTEVAPAQPSVSWSIKKKRKGKSSKKTGKEAVQRGDAGELLQEDADTAAGHSLDTNQPWIERAKCPDGQTKCSWCTEKPEQRAALDTALDMYNKIPRPPPAFRSERAVYVEAVLAARDALEGLFSTEYASSDLHRHCDLKWLHECCTRLYLLRSPRSSKLDYFDSSLVDWATPTTEMPNSCQSGLELIANMLSESLGTSLLVRKTFMAREALYMLLPDSFLDAVGHPAVRESAAEVELSMALLYRAASHNAEVQNVISQNLARPLERTGLSGYTTLTDKFTAQDASTFSHVHTQTAVRLRLRDELLIPHALPEVNNAKYAHHVLRSPLTPGFRYPSCSTLDDELDYFGTLHILLLPHYTQVKAYVHHQRQVLDPYQEAVVTAYTECLARLALLMKTYTIAQAHSQREWHAYDTYRLARYFGELPDPSTTPPLSEQSALNVGYCLYMLVRRVGDALLEHPVDLLHQYPVDLLLKASESMISLARGTSPTANHPPKGLVDHHLRAFGKMLDQQEQRFAGLRRRQQLEKARRRAAVAARSSSSRWVDRSQPTETLPSQLPPAFDTQLAVLVDARDYFTRTPEELGWPTYHLLSPAGIPPEDIADEDLDSYLNLVDPTSHAYACALAELRARSSADEMKRFDTTIPGPGRQVLLQKTDYVKRARQKQFPPQDVGAGSAQEPEGQP